MTGVYEILSVHIDANCIAWASARQTGMLELKREFGGVQYGGRQRENITFFYLSAVITHPKVQVAEANEGTVLAPHDHSA